jgi:peroxiredoxin
MKKRTAFWPFLGMVIMLACQSKDAQEKKQPKSFDFTISGQIKGISNQQIYLQELSFSDNEPKTVDSTAINNGSFQMSAKATEEGLYRLLTREGASLIFVNDANKLELKATEASLAVQSSSIGSPSNKYLKTMVQELEKRSGELNLISESLSDPKVTGNDTLLAAQQKLLQNKAEDYNKYLLARFNETTDPIIATIALGNTSFPDPLALKPYVESLPKRFPQHKGIAAMVSNYKAANNNNAAQDTANAADDILGKPAPDFTLNDVNGKPVALSSLKGKYVLVDFWASWCAPCRAENPNVVAAYNQLKNKNFTVLGVSLDEDKSAWIKAISDDQLNWKHVSDLKGWASMVVGLYQFNGIPFNVLINPQGIIIGKELRGENLYKQIDALMKN